jgi:cation transport ATPase
MYCASCPYIVKQSLTAVPGVKDVSVSFRNKTAIVTFDDTQTKTGRPDRRDVRDGIPLGGQEPVGPSIFGMEAAMGEKFVAGIVTAAAIAPICAVCILGPAAIGSLFAGAFGWLGDFGPLGTIALMIAAGAGVLVTRDFLRRRRQAPHGHGRSSDAGSHAAQAKMGASRIPAGGQFRRPSNSK